MQNASQVGFVIGYPLFLIIIKAPSLYTIPVFLSMSTTQSQLMQNGESEKNHQASSRELILISTVLFILVTSQALASYTDILSAPVRQSLLPNLSVILFVASQAKFLKDFQVFVHCDWYTEIAVRFSRRSMWRRSRLRANIQPQSMPSSKFISLTRT